MANPPTIEKQNVDIDLAGGLDESVPEEAVDWQKAFTNVENLVAEGGQYKLRKGAATLATTDSDGTTLAPIFRLGALDGGLGLVGNSYQLYHLNETTAELINKGRMPEFSVERKAAGAAGDSTTIVGVAGVAILTNYYAIAYQGEEIDYLTGLTGTLLIVDVMDKTSGNVVKSYRYRHDGVLSQWAMVGVDSRYLHFFNSKRGSITPRFFVIDTDSLPAGPTLSPSFTNFTSAGTNDIVMGVCTISGSSVAVITGTNNRIERWNAAGTSAASAAIAGFTDISGIDTDGTNFYVAGRLMEHTSGSTVSLSGWWRASFSASPWAGVASAGASSGRNMAEGVNPPAAGTAINTFSPASFDGTNDLLSYAAGGGVADMFTVSSGTICALVKVDTASASEDVIFGCHENATGRGCQLSYNTTLGFIGRNNNTGGNTTINVEAPVNQWAFVSYKWDVNTHYMKVNNGPWWTATKTGTGAFAGAATARIGRDYAAAQFADIQVLEVMVSSTVLSDSVIDDLKNYCETRYALDL